MRWSISGIIEGFYGPPWSWDDRALLMRWCHEGGMADYVYAPKDDPLHRERWREPYDGEQLAGFERLVHEGTLRVGFGISPGLSIDYASPDDRAALAVKVDQVVAVGIGLVVLALDDIPFGGGPLGEAHASLTTWLREHLGDRASLVLVPTEYVGTRSTPYLTALARGVPDDVPIAWTGSMVVNEAISVAEAEARAEALGGRPPLVWDNFPVNDAVMTDRLHLGPLWGREEGLVGVCSGYLANPMVQPRASMVPLASITAWLQGNDPLDAWVQAADSLGVRVLAEACDGAVPGALVTAAVDWLDDDERASEHLDALREWLEGAAACDTGALGVEAAPWCDQVQAEARVGLDALKLIDVARSGRFEKVVDYSFRVAFGAGELRKARVSVMGPRWGLQPALGQRPDGTWSIHRSTLLEDQNAIDALVRAALAFAADRSFSR